MSDSPRVIVTGATGFIGTHVMRRLGARGLEAHASGVDLLRNPGEFRELVSRLRPSHMLHLAWYAVPGTFYTALENYEWPGATVAAVRAFAESGGKRVVAAGTCAEYDHHYGYLSEDLIPVAPLTPYGVAKDAARRLLESYAQRVHLSAAWARLFFIYGPGERSDRLVPSVIRNLLEKREARSTEGQQIRDFLHVQDAADALIEILLGEVTGPINVSSGEPIAVRDVVHMIGEELESTDLIRIGAVPSGDEPPMIVGDNHRLRIEVGWQPQFSLLSGLSDTIDWWRAHGQ
jgi:nucleoside-diphosphate-sugar epimerase